VGVIGRMLLPALPGSLPVGGRLAVIHRGAKTVSRPIVPIIILLLWAAAAQAGAEAPATRFIPLELIIGAAWNGEKTITYPTGRFTEGVEGRGASTWVGPRQWTHPKTGRTMVVYDRSRGGRNPAIQIFAVRDDLAAIGRVADNRFGIAACDQEAKYPLGLWKQGETRSFDYTCWYGDATRAQITTLTIQEIDFDYGGQAHCLKIEWLLRTRDNPRAIDHRIYIFAPGRGVVRQWQTF
jgi:hypothetical protein